jgi:hypothetical protein
MDEIEKLEAHDEAIEMEIYANGKLHFLCEKLNFFQIF